MRGVRVVLLVAHAVIAVIVIGVIPVAVAAFVQKRLKRSQQRSVLHNVKQLQKKANNAAEPLKMEVNIAGNMRNRSSFLLAANPLRSGKFKKILLLR
jgi:hypothetical protein